MNIKKIIFIVVVVAIVVWAGVMAFNKMTANPLAVSSRGLLNEAIQETEYVNGKIQSITPKEGGVLLTVSAEIPDILKAGMASTSIPVIKKIVHVFVAKATNIEGTNNPQAGDIAIAMLDKSVYDGTEFTALKITVYNRAEEMRKQATQFRFLYGEIKKVQGDSFVLKTRVPDTTKLNTIDFSGSFTVPYVEKTYTIFISKDTRFPNADSKIIKKGNIVSAWGSGDLLNETSYTATKILIEK